MSASPQIQRAPEILQFRSTEAVEVAEIWRRFAPSSELLQVDEARCELDWFSVSTPGFSVIEYELAADVRSMIEPEDQLFTCRVTTSSGGSVSARRALRSDLPWASAGETVRAHWEGRANVRALVFDRARVERLARQISGDDTLRVRVKDPQAVDAAAGLQWDRAFEYLASSLMLAEHAGHASPLLLASLEQHALWTALATFSTTFSDTMRRSHQTVAAPKTVRLALSYIDANAHLPITVDDVAVAARISTRGLQYAFKRALGMTPRECLRRARLAGARTDLVTATSGDTLAAIAQRWGFSNVSRFTVAYRAEFDEHPAEVLRRRTR